MSSRDHAPSTEKATRGPVARAATEYVEATDRNNPDVVRSHLYAKTDSGDLWPMCGYGWNRSDGHRYSILRGHRSARGTCAICERHAALGLAPLMNGWPHPTRWL